MLALRLVEVSAKVRLGPPLNEEEDHRLPVWAGVLPLKLTPAAPVADPRGDPSLRPPEYVIQYSR
jgi:uncharacterized protein